MSNYQLSNQEQSKLIIDYGEMVELLLYVYTVCPLALPFIVGAADGKMYYTQWGILSSYLFLLRYIKYWLLSEEVRRF